MATCRSQVPDSPSNPSENPQGWNFGIYDEVESKLTFQRPQGKPRVLSLADIIAIDISPERNSGAILYYTDYDDKEDSGAIPSVKHITFDRLPTIPNLQKLTFPNFLGIEEIHVIVSILSGTGKAEEFYTKALRPLLSTILDREYTTHATTSEKSVTELTKSVILPRANNGKRQRIILLSGDGGVLDIVNVLTARPIIPGYCPPEVSVLPLGTGNALAHSSGVTADNTWGLSSLLRGTPRRIPLLHVTFSPGSRLLAEVDISEEEIPTSHGDTGDPVLYGAVVCSWGMHASLVADSNTPEYRKFGVERFKMAAKEAMFPADGSSPHPYRARVSFRRAGTTEGEGWTKIEREEHAYVLATLVSNLEKTFTVSPASKPLDGHLRLVHFGPMPGDEVMRLMGCAYDSGKHVEEKTVGYEDVEAVRIDFEDGEDDARWRRICVDGKIVRVERGGWVEIKKDEKHVLDLVSVKASDC